jgi:hypothetical protein
VTLEHLRGIAPTTNINDTDTDTDTHIEYCRLELTPPWTARPRSQRRHSQHCLRVPARHRGTADHLALTHACTHIHTHTERMHTQTHTQSDVQSLPRTTARHGIAQPSTAHTRRQHGKPTTRLLCRCAKVTQDHQQLLLRHRRHRRPLALDASLRHHSPTTQPHVSHARTWHANPTPTKRRAINASRGEAAPTRRRQRYTPAPR